jgi:hypothetical protein
MEQGTNFKLAFCTLHMIIIKFYFIKIYNFYATGLLQVACGYWAAL